MKIKYAVFVLFISALAILTYKYLNSEANYTWSSNNTTYKYTISYSSLGKSFGSNTGALYSLIENQEISAAIKGTMLISQQDSNRLRIQIHPQKFLYTYKKDKQITHIPSTNFDFYVNWNLKDGFTDIFMPKSLLREQIYLAKDILALLQIKTLKNPTLRWSINHDSIENKELKQYSYSPSIIELFESGNLSKYYTIDDDKQTTSEESSYQLAEHKVQNLLGSRNEKFFIDKELVSENSKKISLSFKSSSAYSPEKIPDVFDRRSFSQDDLSGKYTTKRLTQLSDMETISGRSYDEILKPLLINFNPEIKNQTNLFQSLSSYMRLFPNSVSRIADLLLNYEKSDPQFDIISTALGAVGTPEAQEVMRELINKFEGSKKSQVMLNLAFTNSPTKETEELFWNIFNDFDKTKESKKALYGIGIMSSKLDKDSDRYKDSISKLNSLYSGAHSDSEKETLIKAMANTRSPDFYDIIKDTINDSEALKLVALASLKDIQTPDAKLLLIEYSGSSNSDAQQTALYALSSYDNDRDLIELYKNLLFSGTQTNAHQVLKNLDSPEKSIEVLDLLNTYLQQCPSDTLCKLAKRALN